MPGTVPISSTVQISCEEMSIEAIGSGSFVLRVVLVSGGRSARMFYLKVDYAVCTILVYRPINKQRPRAQETVVLDVL